MFNFMLAIKAGAITVSVDLSELEANNNQRVTGRRKTHAASRGFLVTTRLSLKIDSECFAHDTAVV